METTPVQIEQPFITQSQFMPVWARAIIQGFIILAVPVLLTLISVRVVMTPLFLEFEYNRPGFPLDLYGFTTEDRLAYAPYAVEYLLNGADISYLGDLTFPNGQPLYNARELKHMEDVKVVTRAAYQMLFVVGILTIIASGVLLMSSTTRKYLRQAVFGGSVLTLGLIATIIIAAVIAWDFFFTTFHQIFFESGTWRFAYSDTLIRLFPERFWFDASITIGVLTTVGALTILFITWRWKRATV